LFSKTKSYADWLLVSFLLHPDGKKLLESNDGVLTNETNSRINIQLLQACDLASETKKSIDQNLVSNDEIVEALTAQGIERKLCIMGGEPLCPQNEFLTMLVIIEIRERLPEVPIYLWTGYTVDELQHRSSKHLKEILNSINYLIDGPYVKELRDTTLPMRGSSNQRIIDMQTVDFS
jgi:organic radical activating enzyme